MLGKLTQEQFEHVLDMLILYKQTNPKKVVSFNEKSVKNAIHFMNTTGREFASQLGMNKDDGDN
jgi:hypothetical protein